MDICMACLPCSHWHVSRRGAMPSLSEAVMSTETFAKVLTGKINYLGRNVFAQFSCTAASVFKLIGGE